MEHPNVLLNFLVILALVFIVTPDDASGYRILNYDEKSSTLHPWERIVYRESMPRLQKRLEDANGQDTGDLTTPINSKTEASKDANGNKRTYGFDEKMTEFKTYGKDGERVIYGRVSVPVIVLSSYPEPNQ